MGLVTIPNRPTGSDTRSISAILENFDEITNELNGSLDGANIADNSIGLSELATQPYYSARIVSFSIPNGAGWTEIDTFTSPSSDGITFDGVPNEFTIPVTGLYVCSLNLQYVANATGYRYVSIYNQTAARIIAEDNKTSISSTEVTAASACCVTRLTANDKIKVRALQTSGISLNVDGFVGLSLVNA